MKLPLITIAFIATTSAAHAAPDHREWQGCDYHPVMSADGVTVLYWNADSAGCNAPDASGGSPTQTPTAPPERCRGNRNPDPQPEPEC